MTTSPSQSKLASQLQEVRQKRQHAWECQNKIQDEKYELIELKNNQYKINSVSGCTVIATEISLQLLLGATPSIGMLEEVMKIGGQYSYNWHLDVLELIKYVDRYKFSLDLADSYQAPLKNLSDKIEEMQKKNV